MPQDAEGSVLSLVSPKMLRLRLAALAAVSSLKKREAAKDAVAPPQPMAATTFGRHGSFATTAMLVMSEEAERRAGRSWYMGALCQRAWTGNCVSMRRSWAVVHIW